MASGQLTAPSFSARLVPSFEGLKPSTARFASVGLLKAGQRSFRGLVVKAATVVVPKVTFVFLVCPSLLPLAVKKTHLNFGG